MKLERLKSVALSERHTTSIVSIAAHPYDAMFAIGGADGGVRVYRLGGGTKAELVTSLSVQTKCVNALQFSPGSGMFLATGCSDGSIKIFSHFQPFMSLTGHRLDVTDLEFISEQQLLSCGLDGQVILWNTQQGARIKTLSGFSDSGWIKGVTGFTLPVSGAVLSFALFSDGQGLLATTNAANERRIELRADPCFRDSVKDAVYARKPSFSPDRKLLCIPYGQRKNLHFPAIYAVNVDGVIDFENPKILLGHRTRVSICQFAGRLLTTGASLLTLVSVDGCLSLWTVKPDLWAQLVSVNTPRADQPAEHPAEKPAEQPAQQPAETLKKAAFAECVVVISGLCDFHGVPTGVVWVEKKLFLTSSDGAVTELDFADASFDFVPTIGNRGGAAGATAGTALAGTTVDGKRRVQPVVLTSAVGEPMKKKPRMEQATLQSGAWVVENGRYTGWVLRFSNPTLEASVGNTWTREYASGRVWALAGNSEYCLVYSDSGNAVEGGDIRKFTRFTSENGISEEYQWRVKERVVKMAMLGDMVFVVLENSECVVLSNQATQKRLKTQLPCSGEDVESLELDNTGKLVLRIKHFQGTLRYDELLDGFVALAS